MNGRRREVELPLEVQENIIDNIEKLFPGRVDSYLVRDALISHNWDLEESIRYLHRILSSSKKEEKPAAKKGNSNMRSTKPEQSQSKSSHIPSFEKSTQQFDKKTAKMVNSPKKCELFKKGPTPKEKVKEEETETNDWVLVEESKRTPVIMSHNSSFLREPSYPDKKRLIQSYNIIKLFGETVTRVTAYIKEGIKVMVILRGCSGSGKTTYGKELLEKEGAKYPENHIFSSDNYFVKSDGSYCFDHNYLQDAHEWNQKLVELAAIEGRSPIFVDNTHTRLWEMTAYAKIAVKYGYILETLEPPTPWFFNEDILIRKTRHGTPRETIRNMLDRYEANLSGDDILRKLRLSYSPELKPPQHVLAGLDVPISRKHQHILALPLKKSITYQAAVENNKQLIFPISPKSANNKNNLKQEAEVNVKKTSCNPSSLLPNATPLSDLQTDDLVNLTDSNIPPPISSTVKISSQPIPSKIESSEGSSKLVQNFALLSRKLEVFLENNSLCNEAQEASFSNCVSSSTLDGFSRTVGELDVEEEIVEKLSGCRLNASNDNQRTEKVSHANAGIFSHNEHHQQSFPLPPIPSSNDSNFEYVLISNDNNIVFQKYHFEMENISTIEEFRACNSFLKKPGELDNCSMRLSEESLGNNKNDVCTLTESSDFEIVKNIEFDSSHKTIVANKDNYCVADSILNIKSEGNKCERSTYTEEGEELVTSDTINSLDALFPSVGRDKLEDMFGSGGVDLNWAVGLLLDSGQEMVTSRLVAPSLPQQINQSFSIFLDEGPNVSQGNITDMLIGDSVVSANNDPFNLNRLNRSGSNNKGRTEVSFVGDWDYTRGVPKSIPTELPKVQRVILPRSKQNKSSVGTNTNYADFETLRNITRQTDTDHLPNVLKGNPSFVSAPTLYFQSSSVLMLEKGTMTSDIETNQIVKLDSGVDRLALMFPQISRENLQELFQKCQNDIDWAVGLLLDSGQEMCELYTSLEPLESITVEREAMPVEGSELPSKSPEKKSKRRRRVRHSKSDNELHDNLQKQLENNFLLSERHSSQNIQNDSNMKTQRSVSSENKEISSTAEKLDDDESSTENIEEEIVFMVESDFILQLQSRFGGLIRPNMLAKKNVVSLPLSLARQLHSYIMDSVQEHIQEENVFTDEDEEYARQVQEEEMRSLGTPSLLEIMDEEVALRKCQKESNGGRSMASTLSKQLLLERFPKMDPGTLASILEDTNHSLHQATYVLASAGHEQAEPPQSPPQSPEEKVSLCREEAIKQADAYGDVASQLYELRKNCLRKSQKAYREGNHSVALYYSDMARWYMERIEKSNSMAAKAILTGYEGWTTLDLHFLQVSEALNVLDLFIDEVIRGLQKSGDKKAVVYVITGRGLHSSGGRARLKPAVQSRLVRRDIRFVEQNPGMLKVTIPRSALASYKQLSEAVA